MNFTCIPKRFEGSHELLFSPILLIRRLTRRFQPKQAFVDAAMALANAGTFCLSRVRRKNGLDASRFHGSGNFLFREPISLQRLQATGPQPFLSIRSKQNLPLLPSLQRRPFLHHIEQLKSNRIDLRNVFSILQIRHRRFIFYPWKQGREIFAAARLQHFSKCLHDLLDVLLKRRQPFRNNAFVRVVLWRGDSVGAFTHGSLILEKETRARKPVNAHMKQMSFIA